VLLLIRWLEANVKFKVNEQNFPVATNAMISYSPRTTVEVVERDMAFELTPEQRAQYEHKNTSFRSMVELCKEATRDIIVSEVVKEVGKGRHVFVVAENMRDQAVLSNMVRERLATALIACLGGTPSPNFQTSELARIDNYPSMDFTDEKVAANIVPDYDVVITRSKFNSGYNMTRCTVMVTGVYFGNEADRVQLKGRINRLSQNNDTVFYTHIFPNNTVLEMVHRDYAKVTQINKCLATNRCSLEDMQRLMDTEVGSSRKKKRSKT
jgi:hypothetical protein